MAMVSADGSSQSFGGLTAQISWFGLRVGGHPALSLHSSNEPSELSQWLCHDDSTINIVVVIIIIIIIIDLALWPWQLFQHYRWSCFNLMPSVWEILSWPTMHQALWGWVWIWQTGVLVQSLMHAANVLRVKIEDQLYNFVLPTVSVELLTREIVYLYHGVLVSVLLTFFWSVLNLLSSLLIHLV